MAARSHWERWALAAVLALAAVSFAWHLGSASYFVDEVLSVDASSRPLGQVLHAVAHTEITPPAYFFFQHAWLSLTGSQAEWVARLPSAVCGVLLVAVVYWLATVVIERAPVAFGAALLAALSPFVLEFAQRAQGYLFAALATSAAVAAGLTADRHRGHAKGWLIASGALAALGLTINYTATLVVLPVCAWVATRRAFPSRWRLAFVAACAVVQLALVPLFVIQWHSTPGRHGVGSGADLSLRNLAALVRAPFQGEVDSLAALGVIAAAGAVALLLMAGSRLSARWRLILVIAIGEPAALLALSALGARVALTRYATVAVPFVIVAIAGGIARLPRGPAVAAAVAVLVVALVGVVVNHGRGSFYPDTRGAVDFVQSHQRPGDTVVSPDSPSIAVPLAYYGHARLRPPLPYVVSGSPEAAAAVSRHRRLWVIEQVPDASVTAQALRAAAQPFATRIGYAPRAAREFRSGTPLAVLLLSPVQR